jgi:hypothetical protein
MTTTAEEIERVYIDLSKDFILRDQSWWKTPALLIDTGGFIDKWPISRKLSCFGFCKPSSFSPPTTSCCLLFWYCSPEVDVGSSSEERISLFRFLLTSTCMQFTQCMQCTQQQQQHQQQQLPYVFDSDFPWLSFEYSVPPIFTGSNDLFFNCPALAEPSDDDLSQRPKYKWIIIGASSTGGRIHKDNAGKLTNMCTYPLPLALVIAYAYKPFLLLLLLPLSFASSL